MIGKPQFKLVVVGSTYPVEEVYDLRHPVTRKRYTFVDRQEAEEALARLKQIQPHAPIRVDPM